LNSIIYRFSGCNLFIQYLSINGQQDSRPPSCHPKLETKLENTGFFYGRLKVKLTTLIRHSKYCSTVKQEYVIIVLYDSY